jgi:Ca2+-binding EF-hand superfamily protein
LASRRTVGEVTFEQGFAMGIIKSLIRKPPPSRGSSKAVGPLEALEARVSAFESAPVGKNAAQPRSPNAQEEGAAPAAPAAPPKRRLSLLDKSQTQRQNNIDPVRVATQFSIDTDEVTKMLQYFREVDGETGAVTRVEFRRVLEKLFERDSLEDLLDRAWRVVGGECTELRSRKREPIIMWEASFDAFCAWYSANLFGQVALARQSHNEAMILAFAQEQDVSIFTAERLKATYDSFDIDGSGFIQFDEFRKMLAQLLKVSDESQLPRERVNRFWKEIDVDSSGEVDFQEFGVWYLRYFSPEGGATHASIDPNGLLGKFYSTYDPRRQRSNLVERSLREALRDEELAAAA